MTRALLKSLIRSIKPFVTFAKFANLSVRNDTVMWHYHIQSEEIWELINFNVDHDFGWMGLPPEQKPSNRQNVLS